MSDAELRELDLWIADKFMGWKLIKESNPPAWITSPGGPVVIWEATSFGDAFQPTRLPTAFALVKREIVRRGWGWTATAMPAEPPLRFEIHAHGFDVTEYAESEELAGCLAVKAAIEGIA